MIWLHGAAGSGKSTIATSIEDYFCGMYQLGAYLRFERGKSDPTSVIRELAFSLAKFDPRIGSNILERIKKDMNIASALLSCQFAELLLHPLNDFMTSQPESARDQEVVIIVIDAQDECGTPDNWKDLMHLLRGDFGKLPPIFRFLITSR